MLRAVKTTIKWGSTPIKLITSNGEKPPTLKLFSMGHQRWQYTRGSGTSNVHYEGNKKITPLGWFLLVSYKRSKYFENL